MEIIIKQLKNFSPDLTQAVNSLLVQLNPNARILSDENVKEIINNQSTHLLIARENVNDKIIGMITLITCDALSAKKGLIEDLVVDKNYRGQGIGEKLINFAINEARKEKIKHLDFTSNPRRVEANELYQRLGFKKRDTNVYRINL